MRSSFLLAAIAALASTVSSTILQNGQVRITDYLNTVIHPTAFAASDWKTCPPNATELSYKGRWDSKYISWWSAPGLKFAFTGDRVAIEFGPYTSPGVLIAYRIDGEDWQFTNITTNATHQLVSLSPNIATPVSPSTFELRVTNWAYGVQIKSVLVAADATLIKTPDFSRSIEIIGDSLSAGQYGTLEGLSSYAYGLGAGLGDTEYSITAYPGICLYDKQCYGNLHGQAYQWYYTSDTSGRAIDIWGDKPEKWDFKKQKDADIVIVNLGTNDANSVNGVTTKEYVDKYIELVEAINGVWPNAEIVLISLFGGFNAKGNTYEYSGAFGPEIYSIYQYFNSPDYLCGGTTNFTYPSGPGPVSWNQTKSTMPPLKPSGTMPPLKPSGTMPPPKPSGAPPTKKCTKSFVHYFNTTGIMQHNDIGPQYHPTDVGHVKIASHLIAWVKCTFDWALAATGPEVQSQTLYWNDQEDY